MSDPLRADLDQLEGVVLSHSAMITSLLGLLQRRGLLDQKDVNEVIDLALVGIENAEHNRPEAKRIARHMLEGSLRALGGSPRTGQS